MFLYMYMEGFVNTNAGSPFEIGLKHSNSYANYGVDKTYLKREQQNQPVLGKNNESDSFSKSGFSPETLLNDIIPENIPERLDQVVNDTIDTVTAPDKDNHQRLKTAGIIGTSALIVGGAVLGLTRGKLSARLIKNLGKFIDKGNTKLEELKQKPSTSLLEGYYMSFLKITNSAVSRLRGALFNITPLKDVLFGRLVKNKLKLKKPCDAITNGFRKLSFKTVKSGYKTARKDMNSTLELFSNTNRRIMSGEISGLKTKPDNSVIEKLDSMTGEIRTEFDRSFNPKELDKRNQELIKKFEGLDNKVYDTVYGKLKNFVGDVDEWTTFVPERIVAGEKSAIIENLAKKKRAITNNPTHNYNIMNELMANLEKVLNPIDKDSRNAIKNIKGLNESYVNASGKEETESREKIVRMINFHLHKTMELARNGQYNPTEVKQIESIVRKMGKVLNTDKKGLLEELLTTYKEILPEEEYVRLKKSANKMTKSLNRAVHKEGFEYVDKTRDLAVGSALTDVAIGMGLPLGTTAVAMSVADTKQKKRSVLLKYGLPLLAGVATSTVCTVMLISGGYALMLGSAVSLIGNGIFEKIDNYLIKRDEKKKQNHTDAIKNSK